MRGKVIDLEKERLQKQLLNTINRCNQLSKENNALLAEIKKIHTKNEQMIEKIQALQKKDKYPKIF